MVAWVSSSHHISDVTDDSGDALYELILGKNKQELPLDKFTCGASSVIISPKRGASIPSLVLNGIEIFYDDEERRNNPDVNMREWFRMWPYANKFTPEQAKKYGYGSKQHGFLRDVEWKKWACKGNEIVYEFESNEDTFKEFPYRFKAIQKIVLWEKSARISLNIQNIGDKEMPFAPWHHTYYRIDPDKKDAVQLSKNMPLTAQQKEQRQSLLEQTIEMPNPWSCEVDLPWTAKLQLDFDPWFGSVQLRSEKDKWFICIEPINSNPDEWAEKAKNIQPWKSMEMWFTITLI